METLEINTVVINFTIKGKNTYRNSKKKILHLHHLESGIKTKPRRPNGPQVAREGHVTKAKARIG